MYKNLSFKNKRALHIAIVLSLTIAMEQLLKIPRTGWTGFTLMMIYVGFDVGSTIQRTFNRFIGVVCGLLISYILWFICRLDYRILFILIPIIVFFAFFSLGKAYAVPTIFTTILTTLGTDYYINDNYTISWLISDYFICTLIAFSISVTCEYFFFRRSHLIYSFYYELQNSMLNHFKSIIKIIEFQPINKSHLLKATILLNKTFLDFNNFVNNTRHDYHQHDELLVELENFLAHTNKIYYHIRYLSINPLDDIRFKELTLELNELIAQNDNFKIRYKL